jgi:hypothetical protein
MQLKITLAGLLVIALLVLTPGMRADPIQVPATASLDRVNMITSVLSTTPTGIHSFTRSHDWDKDTDPPGDPMPEAGVTVPLILLAGSILLLRKRLSAIH